MAASPAQKSCCHDKPQGDKQCADHPSPCDGKDGCCGMHAVKFSLLEKQTAAPITFHPVIQAALIHHFVFPLAIASSSGRSQDKIAGRWQHKHSPPDLHSLYQRYLI